MAEVTVGETYFFREPEQIAAIRDRVLPDLCLQVPGRPLRIWSAGCASGEEPYTLAILALEAGLADRVHILATDLSRTALARAQRARYTRWSLRATPDEACARYFRQSQGEFELVPSVRELVEFGYHNLAADAYPSLCNGIWGIDLILCRNVLIYLDPATIARVARQLLATLTPGGWLVLGASDPPLADFAPCDVVITDAGLLYRRRRPGKSQSPRPDLDWRRSPSEPWKPVAEPTPELVVPEVQGAAPVVPPAPDPQPDPEEAVQAYLRGDYERAGFLASRVTARPDAPAGVWVLLVRATANRGELEAAGKACMAGLERHPTCAELLYLHGLLLAQGGHLNQAVIALRGALYLDRALAVAHLTLGQILARLGERDRARRSLRNAGRVLSQMPAAETVPAGDGECAGRLGEMARVHLALLTEPVGQ
ncbi:MAG: protein-glutamate O-methyltransferase CheR [Gemmatimonadetes bacterium]|nr:protein-glutamate O-methyltransferase CheR [Gemmatimonadota bacterium]